MSFNPENNRIQKQLNQIIKEMNSRRSNIRAKAIKVLGQMDLQIEEIPILLHSKLEQALFDSAAIVRKEAVMTLAFLEREIALPLLEPLLDDLDQSVRSTTIAALSYIGISPKTEVVEKMIEYLNAPEPEIRDRVARALGRMNVLQAKDQLLEVARNDPSPSVRTGAVVGLGILKNEDPELETHIHQLLQSETSNVVVIAINEALGINKL